jgi:hypothetical protein
MRRLVPLLAGFAIACLLAPSALGAEVAAVELRGSSSSASTAVKRFTLVGIHWRGEGRVAFRTRSLEGRWSGWRPAAPEEGDGPTPGTAEAGRRAGWRVGSPWWVGPSDRIETRTSGAVSRVRAYLVWSTESGVPYRRLAATEAPAIVPRAFWGADESIRRAQPSYAPAIRFAVVHHTAGRNDYTRAQAAAVVKAIQLYHVRANGWNDIGYNFLVDRFGTIYEGRFGGMERNVVGAHALGFNKGSVGVAVLGTFGNGAPPQAAQDAVARLLAWRLDVAHVDPTSALSFVSGGSDRFPTGVPVQLGAVSGHRDTGRTECPGGALYARLGAIAAAARAIGLPKIFDPDLDSDEASVRFRARLSSSAAWTVSVTDTAGTEVARGAGTASTVDWTWDTAATAAGTYRWSIRAGGARPATGSFRIAGTTAPLAIPTAAVAPASITPNGDGQSDTASFAYELSAPANVTVSVADASGVGVATVIDRVWTRAGKHAVAIDGAPFVDGAYTVTVTGRTAAGFEVTRSTAFTVSRSLGLVSATPELFSPNGDGRNDRLTLSFALTVPADVRVTILREGRWVATPVAASYAAGTHRFVWDGRRAAGSLRDGAYEALVQVDDQVTSASFAVPFASDTTAPRVRILPGRPLRVGVSEPSSLTLRIDGAIVRREVRKAGIVRIPWRGAARRVRVVALDAAGNSSGPVVRVADPGQ